MRSARIITFMIFALIILSIFNFFRNVSAEEDLLIKVNSDFTINMKSATDFSVNVEMDVVWAIAFGEEYNEAEIQSLLISTDIDDIEALAVIKNNVHNSLSTQMINIFGYGNINALNSKPFIEASLFYENFNANLSSSFFNMNESVNAHDFVNGVLDMGANVSYRFYLQSEHGWNNTFNFILADKMVIKFANTTNVNTELSKAAWTVYNRTGSSTGKTGEIAIGYRNPTSPTAQSEDIFLGFELDCTSGSSTILTINLDGEIVNIKNYNVIPSFINNFDNVPADGLRLLIDNGFITLKDIKQKTYDPLTEIILQALETPQFNQTIDLSFKWGNFSTTNHQDYYELDNMDTNPPIRGVLTDSNILLKINDISSKALFGLVNAGAVANVSKGDINFGDRINSIGNRYNITLKMPEDVVLDNEKPYIWNDSKTFTGNIYSKNPPSYLEEEISTMVEINVKTTDLNLVSFFTGNTQLTFELTLNEECSYNISPVPEEFNLPNKISIDLLNSDALRICFEEGIFSSEDVNAFLTAEKDDFEKRIAKIIPGLEAIGNVNRDTFEKSLQWDGDISKMGEEIPVKTASYAHTSLPVSSMLSIAPPSFKIQTQTYNFTGIEGQSVSYKMIFPQGVDIALSDSFGKVEVKKMSDGRKYFELTIESDESDIFVEVKCDIMPSALFIIGLFMPCIISFFITLVLIIILLMLRKKKKGRKPSREPVEYETPIEEDITRYEEEDYYVPPPPVSK